MILPVVTGFSPIFALTMACSISGINFSYHGAIDRVWESSTEIFDNCLRGVSVP